MLEKFFKLSENHTDAKTEILAGITTFMTMAYILAVNPSIMAATGMDSLTHAIEGYTTKAAWEMTDMFHLEAIKLISASLRDAVENKKEGREGMALGQYIAGMGFSNVGLGIAHSMAHTLGAVYDTPHMCNDAADRYGIQSGLHRREIP